MLVGVGVAVEATVEVGTVHWNKFDSVNEVGEERVVKVITSEDKT